MLEIIETIRDLLEIMSISIKSKGKISCGYILISMHKNIETDSDFLETMS